MERIYEDFEALPATLGADELAGYFGVSRSTAYALLRRPDFPAIKLGNTRLIVQKEKFKIWCDQQSGITVEES